MKRYLIMLSLLLLVGIAFADQITVNYNFPLEGGIDDISEIIELTDENAFVAFVEVANSNSLVLDLAFYDFDGDTILESAFINGISGINTSDDFSSYWQFSINNSSSFTGISDYFPSEGDTISLDYLDNKTEDAIEWLADNQETSGRFGSNLFQSGFGLMALSLANQNNVGIDSQVYTSGINYIENEQQSDAGFGDELYTAVSIMGLLSNGESLTDFDVDNKTAIEYLLENQNSDGGFESGTSISDVDTTSWSIIALVQAGEELPENNGNTPEDYLISVQLENGSWGYNAESTGSVEYTSEALIALAVAESEDSAVQGGINWLSNQQDGEGCFSDGFRTALGSIALRMNNETEKADSALDCLNTMQNGDGSFGRTSNTSNAIDTGLAIIALSNEEFPLTTSVPNTGATEGTLGLNSIIKFIVEIENRGNVTAENVHVSLEGLPEEWILESDSIDSLQPGASEILEIFARLEDIGSFDVQAIVISDTSRTSSLSNFLGLDVEEALLGVNLSFEE
ncbi:MAG: DUF4430 domain-containing protein [archaeon]|nr:DUF4430 domain-containing protein [archaeon]